MQSALRLIKMVLFARKIRNFQQEKFNSVLTLCKMPLPRLRIELRTYAGASSNRELK